MRIYLQCRTSSLEGNLAGESFDPPFETHFALQFASDQLSSADKSSCLATVEDPDVISKEKSRRSGVRQFRGSALLIGLVALPVLWSLPDAAPARQWLELERKWRSADLLRPALIGGS